jgi:16S rRNA (adenine1518-N6/adenine1519-N6)-dimethyltransferase
MYIKPKKRLGQNFLIDKNLQKKIVQAAEFIGSDTVLEIGSGRAELTRLIAAVAGKVYALEIDRSLCAIMQDTLKDYGNIIIINRDILKLDLEKYFDKTETKIRIIGNIPYYITTPIIEHLLKYRNKIKDIFITVQKEFAERLTANPGPKEYGSLTCFVQYYMQPKYLFTLRKSCFRPVPEVDSALIRLDIRQEPAVKVKSEELLFKIIRAAFNQRRKTLKNSLKGILPTESLGKFSKARPEDLSLGDFAHLANL